MDEYIKREDAIKHLIAECIVKYPISFGFGLQAAVKELRKIPAAEVVPKSEYEDLKLKYADLVKDHDELLAWGGHIKSAEKVAIKAEAAREIFEAIDAALEKTIDLANEDIAEATTKEDSIAVASKNGALLMIHTIRTCLKTMEREYVAGE